MSSEGKNKCSVCKQAGHNKQNCPTAQLMKDHKADQFIQILEAMPLKETILSLLFIYAWRKAYGDSFSVGDIALGITYGFTIPDALKGGIVANTYATSALGLLGAGLIPDDVLEKIKEAGGSALDYYLASASPAYLALKVAGGVKEEFISAVTKILSVRTGVF